MYSQDKMQEYNSPADHGFVFKKRFQAIDWKKIAAADIESISRNLDFVTLQENVANITFCNIESELDYRMIDPNFVKLFKLAQLTIEYLLHSQDYLASHVTSVENTVMDLNKELERKKQEIINTKKQLEECRLECRRRKKLLQSQQQILQSSPNAYHKCTHCSKAFMNWSFLLSHIHRRHPEQSANFSNSAMSAGGPPQFFQSLPVTQQNQDKDRVIDLEKQLLEIKEELRHTREQMSEERKEARSLQDIKDLERRQYEHEQEQARWKEEVEEKHQEQLMRMQESFEKELKEMYNKTNAAESVAKELQAKIKSRSNLGDLVNADTQYEKEMLRKQREELIQLEKSVKESMVTRLEQEKEKWQQQLLQSNNEPKQKTSVAKPQQPKSPQPIESSKSVTLVEKNDVQQASKRSKPISILRSSMEPPSDDESEMDYTTTAGLSSIKTAGSESLSVAANRQQRLRDQLGRHQNLVQQMRKDMEQLLEDMLDQRGIPPQLKGLTNEQYKHHNGILKQERSAKAAKIENFWEIRAQYVRETDDSCKKKLAENANMHNSRPSKNLAVITRRPVSLPPSSAPVSAPPKPRPRSMSPPTPAPRSASPTQRPTKPSPTANGVVKQSFGDQTNTSSQWDEEDESEEESVEEEETASDEEESRPPAAAKGKYLPDSESGTEDSSDIPDVIPDPVYSVPFKKQPTSTPKNPNKDQGSVVLRQQLTKQAKANTTVLKGARHSTESEEDTFDVSTIDEAPVAPARFTRNSSVNNSAVRSSSATDTSKTMAWGTDSRLTTNSKSTGSFTAPADQDSWASSDDEMDLKELK